MMPPRQRCSASPTHAAFLPGLDVSRRRFRMAGSHEVMFTRPAELARKLVEATHD